MILDEFKRIAETQAPQTLNDRMVTPDEANAVLVNYHRLSPPHRDKYIKLPISNMIEFATMKKPSGALKTYVTEVETIKQPVEAPPLERRDYPDVPDTPDTPDTAVPTPIVETAPEPPPQPKPARKKQRVKEVVEPPKPSVEQAFFTKLVEQINELKQQQPVVVEANVQTTEAHVEKLCEIENAMLHTLNAMAERIENVAATSGESQGVLIEVIAAQRTMIEQLHEQQAQIVHTQSQLVGALTALTEKIDTLAQSAPVMNPIFNVPPPTIVMNEGKRIKQVERDENGLISKIVEGYETDAA